MTANRDTHADGAVCAVFVLDRATGATHRGSMLPPADAAGQAERLAGVGLMSAGIAHDLGNLMQVIEAGLRGMQRRFDDTTSPEVRFLHGEVCGAARRASGLARRVLDHARGSGNEIEPTDVGQVVAHMRSLIGWSAGPGVRVVVEVEPRLPRVRCCPAELETAVINLVVNARHAMPDGGALTISVTGASDGVTLRVADTGCGMSEAAARQACEPFVTSRADGGGSGLGLAIVAAFVRGLGGSMSVQSEPGHGAAVSLRFVTA